MGEAADQLARIRALTDSHQHSEAMRLLDAMPRESKQPAELGLARARALAGLERFRAAHDVCLSLLHDSPLSPLQRARAQVLDASVLRRAAPLIDDALESALKAAATGERPDLQGDAEARAVAFEARLEAAHLFTRKRCRGLADRELRAAARLAPADPRLAFAQGHVLCAFDDRAVARERFEAALAAAGPTAGDPRARRLGHLGLAHLCTLAGEFDRAHAHLNALDELAAEDLYPRRLRVRVLMSEQRWEPAAKVIGEILAASPFGDGAAADMYERAACMLRAGQTDAAARFWREQVEKGPADGWWPRRARRALELLARPPSPERRKRRLTEFPSVAQLRNHCGPATVELYMRYFGLRAEQVEVARKIKDPEGGTPVYRMRRYLDAAGFVTRRVEAELPQIRNFIDAGIPVIMEEDYSDSRHVAVAIGYDDDRELLEVQDPMTHEIRETAYEDLGALRNLSNHGALVAVPASDAAKVAALDAAGAVECRTIAAIDEAWAALDAGKPEEADRLADESIALRRDYELAWLYKFHRARTRIDEEKSDAARAAIRALAEEIVSIWPDDEFPQQLLGEVLYFEGRYDDALAAFERARDRDQGDANNWSWIADCHLARGRNDAAREALEQVLRRNPAHRRGNENMAQQRHRAGRTQAAWLHNDAARELGPRNAYNHGVHATLLTQAGDLGGAVTAYDTALALDPSRVGYALDRARLLGKLGRADEADSALTALGEARPDDVPLRVEHADMLYASGRPQRALEVCQALLAKNPEHASAHAITGASLCALGKLDEGLQAMRKALSIWPSYAWVHAEMGKHLAAAGRTLEAVQANAAAAGLVGRSDYRLQLARSLAKAGQTQDAARHARQAADAGGLDASQLDSVAELIIADAGIHDANHFFQELGRRYSTEPAVFRAHARACTESFWIPGWAEAPLGRLAELAPEDPYARAERGRRLMGRSLADEEAGERLLRGAIADEPGAVFPRRALAMALRRRGRFAEALEVLAPAKSDYWNDLERVHALLGAGRADEATRVIDAFEKPRKQPDRALPGALVMRYHVARHAGDLKAALALAEQISHEYREKADDGRLDQWEEEKFACLVRLGELERARHWAEQVARDGGGLAVLANDALAAGAVDLAGVLAEQALRLEPDEQTALLVSARLAELGGDDAAAEAGWQRVKSLGDWHAPDEELARFYLGRGDLARASAHAEAAVAGGHTCPWPFAARAQLRYLGGDHAGARADLERAWSLASPTDGQRRHHDVWALKALLDGDLAEAELRFKEALSGSQPLSAADRARIARLREG